MGGAGRLGWAPRRRGAESRAPHVVTRRLAVQMRAWPAWCSAASQGGYIRSARAPESGADHQRQGSGLTRWGWGKRPSRGTKNAPLCLPPADLAPPPPPLHAAWPPVECQQAWCRRHLDGLRGAGSKHTATACSPSRGALAPGPSKTLRHNDRASLLGEGEFVPGASDDSLPSSSSQSFRSCM